MRLNMKRIQSKLRKVRIYDNCKISLSSLMIEDIFQMMTLIDWLTVFSQRKMKSIKLCKVGRIIKFNRVSRINSINRVNSIKSSQQKIY